MEVVAEATVSKVRTEVVEVEALALNTMLFKKN